MARLLADVLGTDTPAFRLALQRLERAAGKPNADIRLMLEVEQAVRSKIKALGLDPAHTTGHELFRALEEKLKSDEIAVRAGLKISSAKQPADVLGDLQKFLSKQTGTTQFFVVKAAAMRALLKKLKPKATMKALGYRSMESMFKHEPIVQLLAATEMFESAEWHKTRLAAYETLQSKDFELRKPTIIVPTSKKWPAIAEAYTKRYRHNILAVTELGGVVLLPLTEDIPLLVIVTIVLTMQAINDIKARTALLKLQQVRPDFGVFFRRTVQQEPMTGIDMGSGELPWKTVHWFYGSKHAPYHPELFEPHLQPDDFIWHDALPNLEKIHPSIGFWSDSYYLGYLDGKDVVSLNVVDVAFGGCNSVPYGRRQLYAMRDHLGKELLARYLHQGNLQALLAQSLSEGLAPAEEFVFDIDDLS